MSKNGTCQTSMLSRKTTEHSPTESSTTVSAASYATISTASSATVSSANTTAVYTQQVPPQQQYSPSVQQPQYQQLAQPQPAVQRQQVNIDGKIQCYQCGQYGHMQRSCPRLNNQVHCAEPEYLDDQENQAEQLQASLRKQYQEYDRQNYINVTGNHDDVDYEEYIPPMRDYPRPDEPRKGKAYLTKRLQKWDWTQTDTHDEAIAVLQDERMQDEQQLIHQSLTQLGANWGKALPMYPVHFHTTDGKIKIITVRLSSAGELFN